jgi:4-amino-4-deoxy-L-arabinose transferase-like glycosyltransferase
VYFLAFSVVATKLPHYIAPAYPALALLTARFLVRWARGHVTPARWVLPAGIVGVAVTGVAVGVGLLVAGGAIPLPVRVENFRLFPGVEAWAWIGLMPVLGAAAMAVFLRRGNRPAVVISLAASTVLFVGLTAAFPPAVVDEYKATKELVAKSGARQLDRDARVASLEFTRPSLTYYVGRKVHRLRVSADVPAADRERHLVGMTAEFLDRPEPSYLFVPEPTWRRIEAAVRPGVGRPLTEVAAKYDFTRHAVILAVWNGR